jgi:hypothetical protein
VLFLIVSLNGVTGLELRDELLQDLESGRDHSSKKSGKLVTVEGCE